MLRTVMPVRWASASMVRSACVTSLTRARLHVWMRHQSVYHQIMTPRLISAAVAASEPAGGAALDQVALATGFATITTLGLLWLLRAHRSGRTQLLARAGAFSERVSGLPAWAGLPAGIGGGALLIALLGMYWDISLHIDQ